MRCGIYYIIYELKKMNKFSRTRNTSYILTRIIGLCFAYYGYFFMHVCMLIMFCNPAIVIRIVVGTPTITIDNVHKHRQHHRYPDADSISLVSSTAVPHIYQCKSLFFYFE